MLTIVSAPTIAAPTGPRSTTEASVAEVLGDHCQRGMSAVGVESHSRKRRLSTTRKAQFTCVNGPRAISTAAATTTAAI
jgi:hypothetical protein